MPRRIVHLAIAVVVAGCSFDPSGLLGRDGGTTTPDAATHTPDAATHAPDAATATPDAATATPDAVVYDAETCGWPYDPTHFDPCAIGATPAPLNLASVGNYTYDTDTGTLSHEFGATSQPPSSVVDGVRVLWTSGFSLASASNLRVVGDLPLHIVSIDTISVAGVIDAGSYYTDGTFRSGAGADPAVCPASPPDPGQTCLQHGGSGGGAGAFGSNGGEGGEGGDTHTCVTDGIPGGAGGVALATPPAEIRGGCAGRDGAPNDSAIDFGRGGPGGGALMLTAKTSLTVTGTLHVGGAGGGPGLSHRAGAGGGGSGGFLGLEANTLIITDAATLAANGGGGGGGCDNAAAQPGENGKPGDVVALGGARQGAGGDGGNGGFLTVPAGQPGQLAERGGGGGGGGGGFVLLYQHGSLAIDAATVSPAFTLM